MRGRERQRHDRKSQGDFPSNASDRTSSPPNRTDYARKNEKIGSLLNPYRWRPTMCVGVSALLILTLAAILLFLLVPRKVEVGLWNWADSGVRVCNVTSGTNLTLQEVGATISVHNPNF